MRELLVKLLLLVRLPLVRELLVKLLLVRLPLVRELMVKLLVRLPLVTAPQASACSA